MFKLLKGATVYSPDFLGKKDILICFDKIAAIDENIDISISPEVEIIDCSDKLVFPGFIDLHEHITGGGGEGSYLTRTRDVDAKEMLENGITTVVGVLGADGVTRNMANLYAKAKQLELQGMSTYIFTGSYQIPLITLTGSIQSDMVFVEKVIGVGEICLSDSRSFEPTFEEICRIAAETRNGSLISGKAGVVHFHLGVHEKGLEYLFRLIRETPIPKNHFLPTHVNRTKELFEESIKYLNEGGYIDLTAGFIPDEKDRNCIATYDALKELIERDCDISRVTMSSDANGSVPVFDNAGNVIASDTVSCKILFEEIKIAIKRNNIPIEKALPIITSNAAKVLKINKVKGSIEVAKDADLVVCDKELNIIQVIARGKIYESVD